MYSKVDRIPDFPAMEQRLLRFWAEVDAFNKVREKNKDKPHWSFLDGPITANNPMGVHHAWGRSLKDMFQRYRAMTGRKLRYQNGFDCQGLWVEVEVEKELGFHSKDDIVAYGIDRFVDKCKERVHKYSAIQTEQSIRLGYWMDWSNSYYTMSDENNYTIWHFLKRCHDRGFIYRGYDVMPWCPRCSVGLSQMEMHEGYLHVKDASVVVRFPLRGREREALLVWTTTPWTLTSNVAAAVNPQMYYYRIRQGDWVYYLGAGNWERDRSHDSDGNPTGLKRLPELIGPAEVLGSVPGSELIGLTYDGPFDELEAQNSPGGHPYPDEKLQDTGRSGHRVIPWDLVSETEGTGIVHIAPGCGKEDFELGREHGLVAIAPLDERGHYVEGFGWLTGKDAAQLAHEIIDDLAGKGILVGQEEYGHAYPHCWRCKTPVLFRLVDEWFISMDWRDEIARVVDEIRWIPEFGRERELDWLRNMRDWMISKKRYWGLALPIWVCESCEAFDVIGGREELQQRAIAGWEAFEGHSPHRPWVDGVQIRCASCGGTSRRIPDVGNPWLDAGIVSFSTMGYNTDREYWKQWFPAELVLESFPGQFRNWFYSLLAMSTMLEQRAPFKTLLGHGQVRDAHGQEMHKSLGNAIEFNEAAATIGAEIMRYVFAAQNPANNLNLPAIHRPEQPGKRYLYDEVRRKLLTFWNCYSFYVQYAELDRVDPHELKVPVAERGLLDRWILSRMQRLVAFARECFENYQLHLLMGRWEHFVEEDLSNWYLRRSRRRFWKSESDADKRAAYATLFEVLHGCMRLLAPVLPFLMEEVYQNVVRSVHPEALASVHLLDYPEHDPALVDEQLEHEIDTVIRYKNLGLGLRNQANLKVRQPLQRLLVKPDRAGEREALSKPDLLAMVLEELNVKQLELVEDASSLASERVKLNFAKVGPRYGELVPKIADQLAQHDPRDVRRQIEGDGCRLEVEGRTVLLAAEDVEFVRQEAEGWVSAAEGDAFVALSTTITAELAREGMARDFVRHVQSFRKDRGLNIEDRIHLRYLADGEPARAIAEWADYIRGETLALSLETDSGIDAQKGKQIKLAKQRVVFDLTKAV